MRKFTAGVNRHHIKAYVLTDRFETDDQKVNALLEQINDVIDQSTVNGAFDNTPVYESVHQHSPNADAVLPPRSNVIEKTKSAPIRNRSIQAIKEHGRMLLQKKKTIWKEKSIRACFAALSKNTGQYDACQIL